MGLFNSKQKDDEVKKNPSIFDQSNEMTALDKAKLDVRKGKVRLTKWQKYLEKETGRLHESAKELMRAGKREKAMVVLKLKKMKVNALSTSQDQMLNLENLLLQIEQEEMSIEMVQAVKNGTEALDMIHQVMSVEHVEKLMEDNEEALAKVQEIDDLLTNSDFSIDEFELEKELAGLETGTTHCDAVLPSMPKVPSEKPTLLPEANATQTLEQKKKVLVTSS